MAKVVIYQGVLNDTRKVLSGEVGKIANAILADSQVTVPVKTGNLKRSGFVHEEGPGTYTIGYEAEYAAAVELGGQGRPARPYLTPAATKKRN